MLHFLHILFCTFSVTASSKLCSIIQLEFLHTNTHYDNKYFANLLKVGYQEIKCLKNIHNTPKYVLHW